MKKHLLTTLTIVFIFLSCSNDPIIVDTSDVYTIEDVLRADYNFEPEEFKTFFKAPPKFWDDKDRHVSHYRIPTRLKQNVNLPDFDFKIRYKDVSVLNKANKLLETYINRLLAIVYPEISPSDEKNERQHLNQLHMKIEPIVNAYTLLHSITVSTILNEEKRLVKITLLGSKGKNNLSNNVFLIYSLNDGFLAEETISFEP